MLIEVETETAHIVWNLKSDGSFDIQCTTTRHTLPKINEEPQENTLRLA